MSCLINQSEIHKLVESENANDRRRAAASLGSAFCQISEKDQAWQDLHRLIRDTDISVRREAAEALGSVFPYVTDKKIVWEDLHAAMFDVDEEVRAGAASALGSAFPLLPDKHAAWQDLKRLTRDADISVRREAANAIGSVFEHIPEKNEALNYLTILTMDEHTKVRVYAYNSLGRISILNAIEADDSHKMMKDLEEAVDYFDRSLKEEREKNPAEFCHPFYRSYLAILFQDAKDEEISRYIGEARNAVGGSENKATLLEAIENLANALQESQRLKSKSLEEKAEELNAYKRYYEEAVKILAAAEESAPSAFKLLRKGNPLLEERIQNTISEIQRTARQICKSFNGSGSEYEAASKEINKAAKALSVEDVISVYKCSSRIVKQLENFCKLLPEGEEYPVCEVIKEIELETEVTERLNKIELAISYIASLLENQTLPHKKVNKKAFYQGYQETGRIPLLGPKSIVDGLASEQMFDYDVIFIYNNIDREDVMEIENILESRGIKVWIDVRELRPGESIYKINYMLSKIKNVAVFVGKDGIGPWQDITIRILLGNFAKNRRLIIPILLNSAINEPELPIFMKDLIWIDFRKNDPDPFKQLVWGIKGIKV